MSVQEVDQVIVVSGASGLTLPMRPCSFEPQLPRCAGCRPHHHLPGPAQPHGAGYRGSSHTGAGRRFLVTSAGAPWAPAAQAARCGCYHPWLPGARAGSSHRLVLAGQLGGVPKGVRSRCVPSQMAARTSLGDKIREDRCRLGWGQPVPIKKVMLWQLCGRVHNSGPLMIEAWISLRLKGAFLDLMQSPAAPATRPVKFCPGETDLVLPCRSYVAPAPTLKSTTI